MTEIGKNYYVETVTKYWVGTLVEEGINYVVLEPCAWVQDTGRFCEFLEKGKTDDMAVEPCRNGKMKIYHPSVVGEWPHKLFKEVI